MNITEAMVDKGYEEFLRSCGSERDAIRAALTAALASLSHTMVVKGLECHCTKIEQDETCPVGYPSLLCDDCDGKGIRSALTPTQQAEPFGWLVKDHADGWFFTGSKESLHDYERQGHATKPVYASPQAVPGLEKVAELVRLLDKAETGEVAYQCLANYRAVRRFVQDTPELAALNAEVKP